MTQIDIRPLTREGLKLYKEKSPSKFKHKFGDLDLDNIPDDFDFDAHRKRIIAGLDKPEVIKGFTPSEIEGQDFKVETVSKKETVGESEIQKPEVKKVETKNINKAKKNK